MQDINETTIHGRITRDAELKYTHSGVAVAAFGVAVNGFKKDSVSFYEVQIWKKYAEVMAQYLTKGREVFIRGRHEQNFWVAQDGTKRNKWVLTAEMINLAYVPQTQGQGQAARPAAARPAAQQQRPAAAANPPDNFNDDFFDPNTFDVNGFEPNP